MCESAREKPQDFQIHSHLGVGNLWIKVSPNLVFVRSLERSLKYRIDRGSHSWSTYVNKNIMKVCKVIIRNKIEKMTMMHP